MGRALMGKKVGDRCRVQIDEWNSYDITITGIEKGEDDASLEIRKF